MFALVLLATFVGVQWDGVQEYFTTEPACITQLKLEQARADKSEEWFCLDDKYYPQKYRPDLKVDGKYIGETNDPVK